MIVSKWTTDDELWTLALWQQAACRAEWGIDLPVNPPEQQSWITNTLMHPDVSPEFLVVKTDDGTPFGLAMLDGLDWHNRSARLRITLEPTTLERIDRLEATIRKVCQLGFIKHNLWRLWMTTPDDVPDHHDALSGCNFEPEARRRRALYHQGAFHDELSWSLLRNEWQAET